MLDSKYLIKKGRMVTLPGPVQHSDTRAWGENAADFNHTRFMQPDKRVPAAAFRAFGGGASLCPGRHFATTIILNFTAMLVMHSDIVPAGGVWPSITTEKAEG
jgi:cytochrome P450